MWRMHGASAPVGLSVCPQLPPTRPLGSTGSSEAVALRRDPSRPCNAAKERRQGKPSDCATHIWGLCVMLLEMQSHHWDPRRAGVWGEQGRIGMEEGGGCLGVGGV